MSFLLMRGSVASVSALISTRPDADVVPRSLGLARPTLQGAILDGDTLRSDAVQADARTVRCEAVRWRTPEAGHKSHGRVVLKTQGTSVPRPA